HRRKHLRRSDAPCRPCHEGRPCGEDGRCCRKYTEWADRQNAKTNLLLAVGMDNVRDEHEPRMRTASAVETDAETNEILRLVDEKLPVEMRADLLKLRAGVHVGKQRRLNVIQAVSTILADAGVELQGLPPPTDEDEQEAA